MGFTVLKEKKHNVQDIHFRIEQVRNKKTDECVMYINRYINNNIKMLLTYLLMT